MVIARLLLVFAVLGGSSLSATAFGASPLFYLTLAAPKVEYGKALAVTLHARFAKPSLGTVDLTPLDGNFAVETPYGIERDTARARQSWRILLYPRHSGETRIPGLTFHGIRTPPARVDVVPAQDRGDAAPIRVVSTVGAATVWVGQPVQVAVQVTSDYPFALLSTSSMQKDGIEVQPSPFTQRTTSGAGKQLTQYRIGWVLYPQNAGTFTVQLPAVEYQREGIVTRRFFLPRLSLRVRALPAFVPPSMPVGRMAVKVMRPDRPFFIEHEPSFLELTITAEGMSRPQPWQVLRQLGSTRAVAFYPPEEVRPPHGGDARAVSYRIPFVPQAMGMLSLPTIRLQFFDPSTGKIVTRTESLGAIVSLSRWVVYAGAVVLLSGILALTGFAYRRSKPGWKIYRAYLSAWRAIKHAETAEGMRLGLGAIVRAESSSPHPTLEAWLNDRAARRSVPLADAQSVRLLQRALYSRDAAPVEDIRRGLIGLCHRRMPLLRVVDYWLNFSSGKGRA